MRKRLSALLLCFFMMLTLLPTPTYAALGDLLGNSPAVNQTLLDELKSLTGQDGEAIQALLEQYGLLDENGNLVTDRTVELDGVSYTLDEIEALLSDPATDLSQIGYVDGVPIALGDLKTIIAIERELQRIQETYFSGKAFEGEALDNLNDLMNQLQAGGITITGDSQAGASVEKVSLDVSGFKSLEFGPSYGNGRGLTSGLTSGAGEVTVTYNPGLAGDIIEKIVVGQFTNGSEDGVEPSTSVTLTQDNPTGTVPLVNMGRLRIYVYLKVPGKDFSHYAYGTLAGSVTLSDPTGTMVFQDGSSYSDAHTVLLTTQRTVPNLSPIVDLGTSQHEHGKDSNVFFDFGDSQKIAEMDALRKLIQDVRGEAVTESNAVFYQLTGSFAQENNKTQGMPLSNASNLRYCIFYPKVVNDTMEGAWKDWWNEVLDYTIHAQWTVEYGGDSVLHQDSTKPFSLVGWSATAERAIPDQFYVAEVFDSIRGPDTVTTFVKDAKLELLNDKTDPVLESISAPRGTYYPGQVIPVTLTFDELVKVEDGTVITINNQEYSSKDLSMNTAGNQIMLWYRVRPTDNTDLTISFGDGSGSGLSDVWGNPVEINGETVDGVSLVGIQRRSAVTGMDATITDGSYGVKTITASITLDSNTAYLQDIQDYANKNGGVLPFRVAIYYSGDEVLAYLPIKMDDSSGNTVFVTDPYELPSGVGSANWFKAALQVNEQEYSNPNWEELSWWSKNFSGGITSPVTHVLLETNMYEGFTITSNPVTWPTLTATPYSGVAGTPTHNTGRWVCVNTDESITSPLATITEDSSNHLTAKVVANNNGESGWIQCTFVADNGTSDTSDDVVSNDLEFYVVGGDAPFLGFAFDTVTAIRYAALTLNWGNNLGNYGGGSQLTVQLYRGDFTDESLPLDEQALVATYTAAKEATSFQIPAGVLSELNPDGNVDYTVVISAANPLTEGETLSDRQGILLEAQPVTAKLIRPDPLYYTDQDGDVEIGWELTGLAQGQNATLMIQRVLADNSVETYATQLLSEAEGSYSLHLAAVERGLKDIYQVTLTVNNGDQAPSTDSFALHVYNHSALKIVDENGDRLTVLNMGNENTVMNYTSSSNTAGQDTKTVLGLRQQLGLLEYIGINYDDYSWSSFRDGIKWATSNDAISINYKQGGLYENIEKFNYDTYLPELLMGISSTQDGTATITATHAATNMQDSIIVSASTLKDKFYLFQITPAATTTLRYTNGNHDPKEVTTNEDGVLALYEPYGIASDVQFSSEVTVDGKQTEYLGTIRQEDLLSGEGDATKLQLYPLNTCYLREAAKVELTLVTPDGSPLASSSVTIRGGVFRNGSFCEEAGLGDSRNAAFDNAGAAQRETGTRFTTDENGKVTIYFNAAQFTTRADPGTLLPSDQIEYVLEIRDIAGDAYYPLFLSVSGNVSPQKEMRTAASVVVLESVPSGEANKPFIAQQTVTATDSSGRTGEAMDVRHSTGFVGPNSSFPRADLNTKILVWGETAETDYTSNNYQLQIVDENGYIPTSGLTVNNTRYPFASIPVVECDMVLRADTMTGAGWVADGEDVGLKVRLNHLEGEEDNQVWTLLREITLPFRVIDLTNVPQVDQDENVTGMLFTMTKASALEGATNAFASMSGDNVASKLTSSLLNLTGGIDSGMFKMLVTPSEDPTVFNALIWAGYDDLELADVDYSESGIAVEPYSSEFEVGLPTPDKVSSMARGSYIPTSVSTTHRVGLDSTGADLKLNLEGFYEAEIRYDLQEGTWKVYTKGGGFAAGVGVEFGFDVNAMVGPVPVTGSFRVGGAVQLSFETALRYNQGEDPVNDFLTNLRLNAYVKAFGGIGFDYTLVALKIGLFGELGVDSQNRFLTKAAGGDMQGQQLALNSRVGMKFVAEFLCISYEAVLASVSYNHNWTYNDWDDMEAYWGGTGTGLSLQNLRASAAPNGLSVVSTSATLQSRDYLEQYARTWGQTQARNALLSLDQENGLENLQTNANPGSYPEISDDGQILAYVSDSNSGDIYDSRVHVSMLNGSSYEESKEIASPSGFTGYGDSEVDLAGSGSFAAAAWVRLSDDLDGKNADDPITLDDQNTLMNGAEIVASIYDGNSWTSTRLTDNSAPDLAPAVAVSGDRAIVFWRNAVSNAESTGNEDELLTFDAQDSLMYSIYENGSWSTPAMLYNGSNGSVMALQAAMLPDSTAIAVYTLDRSQVDANGSYEIGYTIIDANGNLGTSMLVTSDTWLDENPQVVTANFGSGDNRFVIGWHSLRDDESDIQMLAVSNQGAMSTDFPASLTSLIRDGSATVSGDFRFASMDASNSISDLTITWSETVTDKVTDGLTVAAHSELKAAKLLHSSTDASYRLSSPLELAVLPANNLVNHFSPYLSGSDQIKAVIQATQYDNSNPVQVTDSEGNPVTDSSGQYIYVPGEEAKLYTATSDFQPYAVEVEAIGVDYENLTCNSLTPIQFQIRNTGLEDVSGLTVTVGTETTSTTELLQPGESTTLTLQYPVGDTVTNPTYTVAGSNISETGTVYLDYPDIGISQMKVLEEQAGKRTIAVTLYNAADATLAGNKGREVKLAFYTDNLLTDAAPIACATAGVTVDGNTITISGETSLSRIDDGTLTLVLTYDVGSYVKNTLKEEEIPDSGVYLYADVWTEGKVGEQAETQRLPEYRDSDNQTAVLLTGAYARSGHQYTSLDAEQSTSDTGTTTATIKLTNNSLQPYLGTNLVAVLLNDMDEPLESKIVSDIATSLPGETWDKTTVTFSQKGTRVLVYPFSVDDALYFEGLPITKDNFSSDGNGNFTLTYRMSQYDTAMQLLITAYSNDGGSLNGTSFTAVGSTAVSLQELRMQGAQPKTIVMQVGKNHFTLTLEPTDYGSGHAQIPTITEQPQDAAYFVGDKAKALSIKARVSDGGTLSYQWYRTDLLTSGSQAEAISGATGFSYLPPTDSPSTFSYYCQVTNTLPSGESVSTVSHTAVITVTEQAAAEYRITFDPAGGTCSTSSALTVDGKLAQLPEATREGYTFDGWFTQAIGGDEITPDTVFTTNATIYAHWTKEDETPGGGESGGSSQGSTSYYRIIVEESGNGEVTANRISASAGTTITLTVTPDEDFRIADLSVTDKNGKAIALNHKADGTYTFTMPASAVTVRASFTEITQSGPLFADVSSDAYYYDAVNWAVANGVTSGTSANMFSPNSVCTRAQMVMFLWRAAGSPTPHSGVNPFEDVSTDAYYYTAVQWAVEQGITGGTSATTFSPDEMVTRGQTVTFLWRYSGSPEASASSFTDVAADAYYATAVAWAAKEGITSGTSATTFSPDAPCTRAQIVTFLYRVR